VAGSQVSVVQALLSSQWTFLSLTQPVARLQPSSVQAFPSLQSIFEFTQPVFGSQESFVQALPSSHAPLSGAWTHPRTASQLSTVQATPSSTTQSP